MAANELLLAWLKDAHAMEEALIPNKDFVVDYAAEHLEIASYQRLIIAARELGDEATASTCEQILTEEYAMARAIEENLPVVVRDTLHSQAAAR